jgi:shikimate kinase
MAAGVSDHVRGIEEIIEMIIASRRNGSAGPYKKRALEVSMIQLVGPGGAGKTTVGLALARRLGFAFIDLHKHFTLISGDISLYIEEHGYRAYANRNIQAYVNVIDSCREKTVLALSSGFMTYGNDHHGDYQSIYWHLVSSPSTVVLLPSLDYETCVVETVARQLTRPFSRTAEREEEVIRERFGFYWGLPVKKIETMKPVDSVVDHLLLHLPI